MNSIAGSIGKELHGESFLKQDTDSYIGIGNDLGFSTPINSDPKVALKSVKVDTLVKKKKGITKNKKRKTQDRKTVNKIQHNKLLSETIILIKAQFENEKQVFISLRKYLFDGPGKSLNYRKKILRKESKIHKISYSYLCKLIRAVILEKELDLEPGTLKELIARLLLGVKNHSQRILIYQRAVELAGLDTVKSTHIKIAIEEIVPSKDSIDKKPSSLSKTKSVKDRKSTATEIDDDPSNVPGSHVDNLFNDNSTDEDKPISWANVEDIYNEIEPIIKSKANKILLLKAINTSNPFWKVFKVLINVKLSEKNANKLVDLVDPNNKYRKIISDRENNKHQKESKPESVNDGK